MWGIDIVYFKITNKSLTAMNNLTAKSGIIVLIVSTIICFTSCQKKADLPVVTTAAASAVTTSTATLGGNVTDDGG